MKKIFTIGCFICIGFIFNGCAPDDNNPPQDGEWKLLGDQYFGNKAGANYSIEANNNNVYVGYWDGDLNQPCVKKYKNASDTWEFYGGGPVNISSIDIDPVFTPRTFKFRQDGADSYIGFNADFTNYAHSEFHIFKTNGSGGWTELPIVPMNILPGFNAGLGESVEWDFDFTVHNGSVYVVVNYNNWEFPNEKTSLEVFVYNGSTWTLLPNSMGYGIIDSFFWIQHFSLPRITVSDNGNIYLNYYKYDYATEVWWTEVAKHNGTTWDVINDQNLNSYAGEEEYNLQYYSEGLSDFLVMYPDALNGYPAFYYNGSSWSSLPDLGASGGWFVSSTFTDCSTCIVAHVANKMMYYNGSDWMSLGDISFMEGMDNEYENIVDFDNGRVYVVWSNSNDSDFSLIDDISVYYYEF